VLYAALQQVPCFAAGIARHREVASRNRHDWDAETTLKPKRHAAAPIGSLDYSKVANATAIVRNVSSLGCRIDSRCFAQLQSSKQ
jgi:hypothetical protein